MHIPKGTTAELSLVTFREALEAGAIERTRYDSYLKLYEKASQINLWEIKK